MRVDGLRSGGSVTELKGRTAIVTGAAMGLGYHYALALGGAGVNVGICDIKREVLGLPERLTDLGVDALAWQGNVADPAHVAAVVEGVRSRFGRIDILINNAGVWHETRADDPLDKTMMDYESVVGTNLKGVYLFGRAVIPVLLEQGGGGEIVNIATDHMVTCGTPWEVCPRLETCPWKKAPRPTGGGDGMDLYDAAKWGMNGLLYAWARALAPAGIRVNQFCMGATDTNMLRAFYGYDADAESDPAWMRPEDNARVLVELLEEGPTGRNAQSINFCVGRPVRLEPPLPQRYVDPDQVRLAP
jgi:NAD(P)-dependent dehydrogenase (short-subunit alcohol dehydrogenase family)